MLAHASTAQFTFVLFGSVSKWLDQNAWVGFVIGFAALVLAVVWPDLKKQLPDWELPKTPHEKIQALDERCTEHFKVQAELHDGVMEMNRLLSERVADLAEDRTKAIGERSELSTRIYAVERKSNAAETALEEIRPWIRDLQSGLRIVKKTSDTTLVELASFGPYMSDISMLISDADALFGYLNQIKLQCASSEVVNAPFSRRWHSEPAKYDPFVIRWALLVERHVGKCCGFALSFGISQDQVVVEELTICANSWHQNESMEHSLKLLEKQREKLKGNRESYAAKFAGHVAAVVSSTISRIDHT